MNEDTKMEVIKALAYGEDIEDVANMAETEPEEIEQLKKTYADEIRRRQEMIAGGAENGN